MGKEKVNGIELFIDESDHRIPEERDFGESMMVLERVDGEGLIEWKKVGKEGIYLNQKCYQTNKLPNLEVLLISPRRTFLEDKQLLLESFKDNMFQYIR